MASYIPVICAASLLSACGMQAHDFPSLAKRPVEEGNAMSESLNVAPDGIASLPAELQKSVNDLVGKSNAAHGVFLNALTAARARTGAARGSAVASEAWVVAQMELAALEITRSPSIDALAKIEDIYAARLDAEFEDALPGGAALIGIERAKILEEVAFQQDAMDKLKSQLR